MNYGYANSLYSRDTATPMIVDTSPNISAGPAGKSVAAQGFLDLSEEALDALIGRVEQARTHALALSPDDYQLLLSAVMTLASMQEQLTHDDLTIRKMRKMLGIVRTSEKLSDLLPSDEAADTQQDNAEGKPEDGSGGPSGAALRRSVRIGARVARRSHRAPRLPCVITRSRICARGIIVRAVTPARCTSTYPGSCCASVGIHPTAPHAT